MTSTMAILLRLYSAPPHLSRSYAWWIVTQKGGRRGRREVLYAISIIGRDAKSRLHLLSYPKQPERQGDQREVLRLPSMLLKGVENRTFGDNDWGHVRVGIQRHTNGRKSTATPGNPD